MLEGIMDTPQECIGERTKVRIVDVAVPQPMEIRGVDTHCAVSQVIHERHVERRL